MLLGITETSAGAADYQAATSLAGEMLSQLPQASADGMDAQLAAMVEAHDQLVAAGPEAENHAALVQAAQQPYDELVNWLATQSTQIGAGLDAQLTEHASTVQGALVWIAIGMVAAALAAGAGLSQPLRRYR